MRNYIQSRLIRRKQLNLGNLDLFQSKLSVIAKSKSKINLKLTYLDLKAFFLAAAPLVVGVPIRLNKSAVGSATAGLGGGTLPALDGGPPEGGGGGGGV